MGSNKKAKEMLIKKYGKICFIEKLHLRKDSKRVYKSKKQKEKMKQLTYHHILEKQRGGQATVENGALLSAENHAWFHKQNEASKSYMNQLSQEYKRQIDLGVAIIIPAVGTIQTKKVEFDMDDYIEIETKNYNRAEYKRMMQNIRQEYIDR